jgi:hypothetical protein
MKLTLLTYLLFIILFFLVPALFLRFAVPHLPVNDSPCFGKAKDGRYRWHSLQDCNHNP